jgi:uroporphyrin-3 C-methyltransferase
MPEAQEKIDKNENRPDSKQKKSASTAKEPVSAAVKEPAKESKAAEKKEPAREKEAAKKTVSTNVTEMGTPAAQGSRKGGGTGTFLAFVALVVALGAFGAGYLAWQKIGNEQNTLTNKIDSLQSTTESNQSTTAALKQTNETLQSRFEAIEGELNSSVSKLREDDSSLNTALANLSEKLSASRSDDWLVAEARHMINIANQETRLSGNVNAAIAALEAADSRLRDASDPTLLKVRQAVTDDIVTLRGIGAVDISGIALTLSTLEQGVDQMPLRNKGSESTATTEAAAETAAAEEEVSGIGSFFSKIWNDIKGLVSIRRTSEERTNAALLPPGQKFFLQQNLRLKLEGARLALLQRDTKTFHDSLVTAAKWADTYYDTSATSTANLLTTLSTYQDVELQPALPDISGALKALDEWRSKQHKGEAEVSTQ